MRPSSQTGRRRKDARKREGPPARAGGLPGTGTLVVGARGVVVRAEAVEVDEAQVALAERGVIGEDAVGVPLRLCLLGRLDGNVPVAPQAGTGRDELTDGYVLLQADQRGGLAL